MLDWLLPALGAALLAVLAIDVFQTVFHAQGRGGPLNRRQNRTLWRIIRRIATRGGRVRPGTLALAGALMAVTTIAVWAVLLLGGFWLVYFPFILDFHFSPGQPGSAALEAFYYSGIMGATLGQGDVVAPGGWLRAVSVVQAVAGFAAVTVAVTYVLAVYRELVAAQSLAAGIDARLSMPGSGAPDETPDWDRSFTFRIARVIESHYNYPILHYFRPPREERALPYQVARLSRLGEGPAGRHPTGPDDDPDAGGTISRAALMAIIHRYATEVHALFVPGEAEDSVDGREGKETQNESEATARRLERILGMMAYPSPFDEGSRSG